MLFFTLILKTYFDLIDDSPNKGILNIVVLFNAGVDCATGFIYNIKLLVNK